MKEFRDKIAVITGAGSGMGKQLALQLLREGAHVAICDVFPDLLADAETECRAIADDKLKVTARVCDVASETAVLAFRDAICTEHGTDHINVLINNAGIGGGGSFIKDARAQWDRTFAVCWNGVYHCTRAFMPLLVKSSEGRIVNISSVNGFFAANVDRPHTAYSAAKFAVKGFSEALYTDLRFNAPHVRISLVMPGHVGTGIVPNSLRSHGIEPLINADESQLPQLREWLDSQGIATAGVSDSELRGIAQEFVGRFQRLAPLTPLQAANIILDGVRADRFRILVGQDAAIMDETARSDPERLYEPKSIMAMFGRIMEARRTAAKRETEPSHG